jgi:hypothetical protein
MESTAEFEKETIAEKKRRIASMNMEHTAKRVKITTGTSPWIVEQLSEWNPHSYLSLPGSSQDILDYAMGKSAFNPSKHKREKIAVFLGSINNRLDFRLLSEIAEQLSDWKIVLAGPVYNMLPEDELIFDDLIKKSNVEYKKPLSRLEIADLLSNASAGLLPYSKDPKRKNMEHVVPHKLGDYISCGISIVSIETKFYKEAFAGNYGFPRGYIRVAKDAKGFAKCACEALNDYSMENMEKRFLFAQNNTFVHRVQFLIDKLQSMK